MCSYNSCPWLRSTAAICSRSGSFRLCTVARSSTSEKLVPPARPLATVTRLSGGRMVEKGAEMVTSGQIAGFGRLADLDAVAQSGEQFGDGGEFREMEVHEAGAQDEGANGFGVALLLSGEDLAEHGERVSGGVSDDPGERRGDLDAAPAAVGLGLMQVFPLVELHLSGDGLEGDGEFGAEIEGAEGDLAVEVAEFGEGPLGAADGFALGAFDGVAEDAAGTEEKGQGVEVGREAASGRPWRRPW